MGNRASSGIPGFDSIVQGLRLGDNVVWQVDDTGSYRELVAAFAAQAARDSRKLVYLRFGRHASLVGQDAAEVITLEAADGFETFSRQVHTIAAEKGPGAYYIFDCLSDLLYSWATDQMIGNFFTVTCPYLRDLQTIAYFAIQRGCHSNRTVARIRETTQLLVDVHHHDGRDYVHPIKVLGRYSPTMFLPHLLEGDRVTPVTSSVEASRLFAHIGQRAADLRRPPDYWDYLFARAAEAAERDLPAGKRAEITGELCRKVMSADPGLIALIQRYLSPADLVSLRSRIVGTGFIGGKTVGMLLARSILLADRSFDWMRNFEPHDSWYVGSDVFYTYIVQNGWWPLWMEQKTGEGYFTVGATLKEKLLAGEFPEEVRDSFHQLIDYFGQSPIIVRSSSLQEDAFGSIFAGKYESVFLANQGSPEDRYEKFLQAVRTVYASTMSEEALAYRRRRGLDRRDEQMALLVQRVSGDYHGRYFFPFCAGVGISYNMFVWRPEIDPDAGMLRLVFGLGTRAVNRVEGDYPRIVALDSPVSRPLAGSEEIRRFSQRDVDVIDTASDKLVTVPLPEVAAQDAGLPLDLVGSPAPGEPGNWLLTFDRLLTESGLAGMMRRLLRTLHEAYGRPVDIEFTLNFDAVGAPQVNLVQCRPMQTRSLGPPVAIPAKVDRERLVFGATGGFVGGNVSQPLRRIIRVDPRGYLALPVSDKYQVARLLGRLNRLEPDRERMPTMLMGPGRWGTTTPSLGIPVSFYEINNVAVLCELEFPEGNLAPEPSFGTHFFHDLVESSIFYVALFEKAEGTVLSTDWFSSARDRFAELLPGQDRFAGVISVYDPPEAVVIVSDVVSQKVVCFQP